MHQPNKVFILLFMLITFWHIFMHIIKMNMLIYLWYEYAFILIMLLYLYVSVKRIIIRYEIRYEFKFGNSAVAAVR